jgi:hypothetical protein
MGIVVNLPLGITVLSIAILMLIVAIGLIWTLSRWSAVAISLVSVSFVSFACVQFMRGRGQIPAQPRAWLQIANVSAALHTVTLTIKNAGQVPASNTRLTQSFEMDAFDNGKEAIGQAPLGTAQYDQIASGSELTVHLGFDNPIVRQFLAMHRPDGFFSIRVHGRLEYNDTETSTSHPLTFCYADLGFTMADNVGVSCKGTDEDCKSAEMALKNSSKISECPESGLNISR